MPTKTTTRSSSTRPAGAKKPSDRRPKKDKAGEVTFTGVDGERYTLPKVPDNTNPTDYVPGRVWRDATMNPDGEIANMALIFAFVENFDGIDDDTRAALYDLPATKTIETIQEWFDAQQLDGEPLGESSSSSR